jgi:hypothetical protein
MTGGDTFLAVEIGDGRTHGADYETAIQRRIVKPIHHAAGDVDQNEIRIGGERYCAEGGSDPRGVGGCNGVFAPRSKATGDLGNLNCSRSGDAIYK